MDLPPKRPPTTDTSKDQNDLRSALEYQIDIVLRLEEERLLLLKENKIQKEKIRELVSKCNELESKKSSLKESKEIQTSIETQESGVQTDDVKIVDKTQDLDMSVRTEASKADTKSGRLIDEASEYVKKYTDLFEPQMSVQSTTSKKRATTGKAGQKSSRSIISEKENLNNTMNTIEDKNISFVAENLRQEKNILTEELINLNKEVARLRTENRLLNENSKKGEKEKAELRKSLQVKTEIADKLKKENNDLSVILTKDQFKTVRIMEGELKKVVGHNKDLIEELQIARDEKIRLEHELNEFRTHLDKLTEDIELKCKEESELVELRKEKEEYEEKVKGLEKELKSKQEELSIKEQSLQEMQTENGKLMNDVEYFKNIAQTSKSFAEKAIADVEVYRKMLEKMQKS